MAANAAMKRRDFLVQGAATASLLLVPSVYAAPAARQTAVIADLVRNYAGKDTKVTEGRVRFAIDPLIDNGNSVPVEVTVDSPMSAAQHVVGIAIFNEKNPQNEVAEFTLSPLSGRARIATRVRLATSQQLVAIAKMNDGSCFTHTVDILVTVSSCLEE